MGRSTLKIDRYCLFQVMFRVSTLFFRVVSGDETANPGYSFIVKNTSPVPKETLESLAGSHPGDVADDHLSSSKNTKVRNEIGVMVHLGLDWLDWLG